MIAVDTNALAALALETHPDHARALAVFENVLANGEEIALSAAVVAEFLHVVTDARRFAGSQTMSNALVWLEGWEQEIAPRWIAPTDAAIRLWLTWMDRFQLGRKRLLDTQYAAMLHTSGIRRLLTNNKADFELFNVFEILSF